MKKIFKKLIPILLVVAVSVGVSFQLPKSNLSLNKPSKNVAAYKNLNPKLINFFKNIQKEPQNIDQLLLALQPLSLDELNKAYNFAVDSHLYDIATSFYKLGAKDCYQRGRDILLLAINSGQLDLAKDLLNQDYKINNDHINSIRCLLNLNSNNWAFLYNKCFLCEEGFQDYQSSSRDFSKDLLAKYSEQNPVDLSGFDQLPQHQKSYRAIFGEKAIDAFRKEVNYTLDHNYQIIKAAYGSQRTPVIVNSEGKRVAVIKTKNELLAQKLDHEHFAHVPPCIIATVPDYGEVVLQKWVSDSKMAFENQDPKAWSPEQLHHIRALDIRLGNSDRNKGNILVATRENQQYVVPIDHDLLMYYMPNDNNWQANYLNAYFSPLTKEYIEKIARSEYFLSNDGEVIFKLPDNEDSKSDSEGQ